MHQAFLNARLYTKQKINLKSPNRVKTRSFGQSDIHIADKIKRQMVAIVPKAFFPNL